MASLNQKILERVPLDVPTAKVQKAIADVLGALDDKIAANIKLTATVDKLLAADMSRRLASGGAIDVPLREIAAVNARSVKPQPSGSLRYIDIASVGVGVYDYPDVSSWHDAPSRARRSVRRGDILWSTVRPNRRSHALNLSDDPLLVGSTGLAVVTPLKTGFAYLYEILRRPEFTTYLESSADGSAYPAVRADRFAKGLVPLLEREEQNDFEGFAAPLRELVSSMNQENRTLSAIRDALLPQLMSGKLRVKDAEKTAEEVL